MKALQASPPSPCACSTLSCPQERFVCWVRTCLQRSENGVECVRDGNGINVNGYRPGAAIQARWPLFQEKNVEAGWKTFTWDYKAGGFSQYELCKVTHMSLLPPHAHRSAVSVVKWS